jgi:hypothetical protein
MPEFIPPVTMTVPPVLPINSPEQSALQYKLFRHYRNRPEGVNVYILSDWSVTESDPDGTRVVWAPDDRNGEAINAIWVVYAFYGGHGPYFVTDEIAALLVAAGYSLSVSSGAQLEETGGAQLEETGGAQLEEASS